MKTAGEILRQTREKKKLSLRAVAHITHISESFLQALEDDAFELLPSDVSSRGFLTLYAQELGLDPQSVVALYRRDAKVERKDLRNLRGRFFALNQKRFSRSLAYAFCVGIGIGLLAFSISFVMRLRDAPPLTILSPKDGSQVVSPFILRGTSSSDAVIQVDSEAVGVDQDGGFVSEQNLNPGIHIVTIRAIGRNGRERSIQLTVTVQDATDTSK